LSSFLDMPLLPTLLETLGEQGITQPTDIQVQSIPPLLDDRSLMGVSETGSGKTLAYALPLLHKLKTLELAGSIVSMPHHPRGLILVPGRELGEQVSKVLKTLTHKTRVRVRAVLGGSKKKVSRQNVRGVFEILVATPGRLNHLLKEGELTLTDVRTVVFDEADQMVDPGFLPVAKRILGLCPNKTQLVMFSATFPNDLEKVVHDLFSSPPVFIRTHGSQQVVSTLTTVNHTVMKGRRYEVLIEVLGKDPDVGTMAFVNTREQLDKVASRLQDASISFTIYRGQMERLERRANLASFRNGEDSVLLTTDLGGRGLDIERVERVINVHLPQDIDNYLHRVGRTARAGRKGLVVNLVTPRDQPLMAKLTKREERGVGA
jgi:ATP-dependent RNA helicase RhlE